MATAAGRIPVTALEAWLTTYGDWARPLQPGIQGVQPDREVWVVWMYAPGAGPMPTCKPGTPGDVCLRRVPGGDKDSFHDVIDATTGWWYVTRHGKPDWLIGVP